jgi:hypothetical protein
MTYGNAIREEILVYGFDPDLFRLRKKQKCSRRQTNHSDRVLNVALGIIHETLDKLWEVVKAPDLNYGVWVGQHGYDSVADIRSVSAQIQAYETLLTNLAEVTIDVDAIVPQYGSFFCWEPFAFSSAEDQTAEREAVIESLTREIDQRFQERRQSAIQSATDHLQELKNNLRELEALASKPKSLWERLFG